MHTDHNPEVRQRYPLFHHFKDLANANNNNSIRAIYAVARYRISEVPERSKFDYHGIDELDKRGVMSLRPADRLAQLCNGYLTCITQTIQVWPPQHIALSSPFITSCLVGPCSIFVHRRDDGDEMGLLSDILLLAIERFSKYWKLADSLMCVCMLATS